MTFDLSGKRALVTGGTGFIGGRLVERLLRENAQVRVLVRNFMKAPRLARYDVEMMAGDASVQADIDRAVEGCDVVFHCSYGNSGTPEDQKRGTFGSTQYILDAALKHGVQRVVNVSTVAVYGETPDGDLDESAPRKTFGDVYSGSKAEAEELCTRYAKEKGLGVSTIQPAIVYGPFGPAWTLRILNDLKNWRVVLVNGGDGLCNAVYVDDVVEAMILAAQRDEAQGEVFLIAADEPVTWKEFFERHEALLGEKGTVSMSLEDASKQFEARGKRKSLLFTEAKAILQEERSMRRRIRRSTEVNALIGAIKKITPRALQSALKNKATGEENGAASTAPAVTSAVEEEPEKPVQLLPPGVLRVNAAKTRAKIDKARKLLGYQPRYDFDAGMKRVEEWARWANIAPDQTGQNGTPG